MISEALFQTILDTELVSYSNWAAFKYVSDKLYLLSQIWVYQSLQATLSQY